MTNVGEILWEPSQAWVENTNLHAFRRWLAENRQLEFEDLRQLRRWSVDQLEDFWQAIWDYFDIQASSPPTCVLGSRNMPGAQWFPGAKLNYAQHILRQQRPDAPALFFAGENQPLTALPWDQFARDVRVLATQLRALGIKPGDRVAGYLPNIPQAAIALVASSSVGAIWSSCSPDFGARSVLDRLLQIEPKALFCVDGYFYKGRPFNRKDELRNIIRALPSLQQVIYLPYLDPNHAQAPVDEALGWHELMAREEVAPEDFVCEQAPFDHPLWILFSSGTTGLPKAIVHGHGGVILQQLVLSALHYDLKPADRLFFFTTTGWMMWNFVVSSLLAGACPILYDGNPNYPAPDALWKLADEAGARLFGASPTLQRTQENMGVVPKQKYRLEKLESIMLAGSPVSAECAKWFYDNVKDDLYVGPGSGGTDICAGYCGPMPGLPVKAGVIQMPHLGVDLQAFDAQGNSVVNQVGEFVVTQPLPSMPLYLWNDEDNSRYRETYFSDYPGVWRQGDYFMINEEDGCYVLGRSDATLNRHGVRIGTAEVYRGVESLEEVEDSLIVNLELPDGKFFMPLFVKLSQGRELDEALKEKIRQRLRTDFSPRHVPDEIYQVEEIPCTLTGKKMEVPVRKILMGIPAEQAANRGAMANPASLDYFIDFAAQHGGAIPFA